MSDQDIKVGGTCKHGTAMFLNCLECEVESLRQQLEACNNLVVSNDLKRLKQLDEKQQQLLASQKQLEHAATQYQLGIEKLMELHKQDVQRIELSSQLREGRLTKAIHRNLSWWDRDGNPCTCGTCAVCGLREALQSTPTDNTALDEVREALTAICDNEQDKSPGAETRSETLA